jgi:hypothetical protein
MFMTLVTAFMAPFGSQCRAARRAKPALSGGSVALDLRPRALAARAAISNCVAGGAASIKLQVCHD